MCQVLALRSSAGLLREWEGGDGGALAWCGETGIRSGEVGGAKNEVSWRPDVEGEPGELAGDSRATPPLPAFRDL